MKVSVIIPARNEERFIPRCLESIKQAAEQIENEVETVVVLNRCTDKTEEIARRYGAVIAREDAQNLSMIRNAGAAAASGEILVTIDADSWMSPGTLREVCAKIQTERYVGGGSLVRPERLSVGIVCSIAAVLPYLARHGVSFGMFWCNRSDFEAIDGFNPEFVTIEDIDFANRLRRHGRASGRKFGTVWRHPITTSCRKFDEFGDWHLITKRGFLKRVFRGNDTAAGDYWYKVDR